MKKVLVVLAVLFVGLSLAQDMAPLEVSVLDFKDKAQSGEQIIFEGDSSGVVYKGTSGDDGKFKVLLAGGETYMIKIKGFGEEKDYSTIKIPSLGENEVYGEFQLTVRFEQPKIFTLDNVHFDSGKYSITKVSYKELDELLEYMTIKKELKVEIAGHTDNVGEDEENMQLSQNRADAIRNYLLKRGISSTRILAKGYGENQAVWNNNTAEGRQKNRRTEVRIIE